MSGGPYTAHSQNGAVRPFVRFSILFFTAYTETAQTYLIFHIYTLLYSNLFSALLNSHLSSAQNCSLLCSTLISSLLNSFLCSAHLLLAVRCGPVLWSATAPPATARLLEVRSKDLSRHAAPRRRRRRRCPGLSRQRLLCRVIPRN